MDSMNKSIQEYLDKIPDDRKVAYNKLRSNIIENLPKGFEEGISSNMISFYVPKSIYPNGYHVNPDLPLPFISIANQKNFIALYHMGIYANQDIHDWFVAEYPKHCKYKLDMGKSCIRFKKIDHIPYDLIAELIRKISVDDWIASYEKSIIRK